MKGCIVLHKKVYIKCIEIFKSIFHKIVFFIFNLLPVNSKKIVFITLHSDKFSGNNKCIYDELKRRKLGLTYKLYDMDDIKLSNLKIMEKFIMSIGIDYNICTAKYVIINDFYSLFTKVKVRKQTTLIQVWHAGGAFKKFGKMSLRNMNNTEFTKRVHNAHSQYDKLIVSSKEVVDIYSDSLGIDPQKIYPIGIPRADILFNEDRMNVIKQFLYDKYEEFLGEKIILYAPTFRDDDRYRSSIALNLNYMLEHLDEDYLIILKMHPFERSIVKIDSNMSDRIFDLSNEEINDLLIIADILITDYSSLIFEYAILQKPMIFFAYDLEKYENKLRGFYYPYTDFVPGPIAYTTEEVVGYIRKDEWDLDKIRDFAIRFNEYFDGKATERFIEDVLFEEK